jgi:2-C-methyl-D-erythritol 2,4-cyclodiphosphate synthase
MLVGDNCRDGLMSGLKKGKPRCRLIRPAREGGIRHRILYESKREASMRIGMGHDVHRLVLNRPLVLGGVTIPFEKGLLGHSDADVLVHAACDALLGAAGLGDIGIHFPDSDPQLEGIYSIELLRRTAHMVHEQGLSLINMDATVFAQAPKIAPYRDAMRQVMAEALRVTMDRISVKATTTEGLGLIGAGEGMAAMCVVLIGSERA